MSSCATPPSQTETDFSQSEKKNIAENIHSVPDIAAMVPQHIRTDQTLRVGTTIGYRPAEYLEGTNTKLRGYDIDIADALATVMGIENVSIDEVDFPSLLGGLGTDYEIAIADLSVSQGRLNEANFVTYAEGGSLFATSVKEAQKFDPQALCGTTIGALSGSVQNDYLTMVAERCRSADMPAVKVIDKSNEGELLEGLSKNHIEAIFADMEVVQRGIKNNSGTLVAASDIILPQYRGIAIAKNDSQLTVAVQAAVQYLMDKDFFSELFTEYGTINILLDNSVINPSVD